MTAEQRPASEPQRHIWQRYGSDQLPEGSTLAALRSGLGRKAGSVPGMWRHYTTLDAAGRLTAGLQAEHVALTLYAVHQQSQKRSMHREGVGLGTAVAALRDSDKFSSDAVDRRFTAAATATSFGELTAHLRGLVTQLRTVEQPLDYTRLFDELRRWQYPDRMVEIRRAWGAQYFLNARTAKTA